MQIQGIVKEQANNQLNDLKANSKELFTQSVQDAKSKFLQDVPDQLRGNVNFYFDSAFNRYGSVVDNQTNKFNKNIQASGLEDYIFQKTSEAAHDMAIGNTDGSLTAYAQIKNKLNFGLQNDLLNERSAAKMQQNAFKQIQKFGYLGQFENALNQGKGNDYLNKFSNKEPQNLDLNSTQKNTLYAEMSKKGVQAKQQQIIDGQNIQDQMQKSIERVRAGAPIESQQNTVNRVADYYPESSEIYNNALEQARMHASIVDYLKQISPYDQNQVLENFRPKVSDEGFLEQTKIYNGITKDIDSFNKKFKADPASYLWENPSVQKAIERNKLSAQDENGGKRQPLTHYSVNVIDSYFNAAKLKGLDPDNTNILTKSFASKFSSDINQLPLISDAPNQPSQVNQINSLLKRYPGQLAHQNILRQLRKSGVGIATMAGLKASRDPNLLPLLKDYSLSTEAKNSDIETNFKPLGYSDDDLQSAINSNSDFQNFMNSSKNYRNMTPAQEAQIRNDVSKFSKYLLSTGRYSSLSDAVNAAQSIYTSGYQFDSRNNFTYRVPSEVRLNNGTIAPLTLNDVDRTFNILNLGINQNQSKLTIPFNVNPGEIDRQAARKDYIDNHIIGQMSFMTLPDEQHLELIDGNGVPIRINGKLVKVNFKDIADPNSQLNTSPVLNNALPKFGPQFISNPFSHKAIPAGLEDIINNPVKVIEGNEKELESINKFIDKKNNKESQREANLLSAFGLDVPESEIDIPSNNLNANNKNTFNEQFYQNLGEFR